MPDHMKGLMRPILLWRKSSEKTQRKWTTWEGELYSIREGLCHNRDIVAGCHVVIGTDHVNNIIINIPFELRQPAKMLRWLMENASLCFAHWAFTPGAAHIFADAMSRVFLPERENLAAEKIAGASLPKNLKEAFEQLFSNPGSTMSVFTFEKCPGGAL